MTLPYQIRSSAPDTAMSAPMMRCAVNSGKQAEQSLLCVVGSPLNPTGSLPDAGFYLLNWSWMCISFFMEW